MLDSAAIRQHLARIEALKIQGMKDASERWWQELLQLVVLDPRACHEVGTFAFQEGQFSIAEQAFRRAVTLNPGNADLWNDLGVTLRERSVPVEAEECMRMAISLDANKDIYWLNLGATLASAGRWSEAQQSYQSSIALNPRQATAWYHAGLVEDLLGQPARACDAIRRSLELEPENAKFAVAYGAMLARAGQPSEALKVLHGVLRRDNSYLDALIELGNVYRLLGGFDDGETCFRRALHLDSRHSGVRHGLALILLANEKLSQGEELIRAILADEPRSPLAWSLLGQCVRALARTDEAAAAFRRSLELEASPDTHSKLLLSLQCLDNVTPGQLLAEHRAWDTAYASPVSRFPVAPPSASHSKLTIGLVSSDFGQHPLCFVALPLLENLNRQTCSVICYSDRVVEDGYTARFRATADEWRVTMGLSHEELAEQVRNDKVDILVDLMGHAGKRLLVFARQPAPTQVTWFGYVGTTGLAAMTHLLADRFHVRPGEEHLYAESILRMPNGYACYLAPLEAPACDRLPCFKTGRVTFGCFNNPAKYALSSLAAIAAILNRLPDSQILFKFGGLDDQVAQDLIRSRLVNHGANAEQILIEGPSPHIDFLGAYNRVDVALDTQPFSGGVTTCEALWMGVPVVTFPGKTFAGRHATSHLSNAGYPQFVAADLQGYVDLAVEWASRLDELALIRSQMREQVRSSPLCDVPRFASDFLNVLQQAWESRH